MKIKKVYKMIAFLLIVAYICSFTFINYSEDMTNNEDNIFSFLPSADSYIDTGKPTTNYGQDAVLKVREGSVSRRAFIKFDLSDFQQDSINSAKLIVTVANNLSNQTIIKIYGIDNDLWEEVGITAESYIFNSETALLLDTVNIPGNSQYQKFEFNVSSFVSSQLAQDKAVTFALIGDSSTYYTIDFCSKENTNQGYHPQLLLTASNNTVSPTETPAPTETPVPTETPQPTPQAQELEIYNFTIKDINGNNLYSLTPDTTIIAKVNVKNHTGSNRNAAVIVALYDQDDALKNIAFSEKEFLKNTEETFGAGFRTPENVEGYKLKAFLWDGIDTMNALCDPIEILARPIIEEAVIDPLADAYVHESYPDQNVGGRTQELIVKGSNVQGAERISYLKFDLNQYKGKYVQSAILKLYCSSLSGSTPVRAFAVEDDSWGENEITFGNRPLEVGEPLSDIGINEASMWYEFDITTWAASQVSGDGIVSVALIGEQTVERTARFLSKESEIIENRPKLYITLSSHGGQPIPTPTPTPTPTQTPDPIPDVNSLQGSLSRDYSQEEINTFTFALDGVQVNFSGQIKVKDRMIYATAEDIFSMLGISSHYIASSQSVSANKTKITGENIGISIKAGEDKAVVGGKNIKLPLSCELQEDKLFIPLCNLMPLVTSRVIVDENNGIIKIITEEKQHNDLYLSMPKPGDIFREYKWKGPFNNSTGWRRVVDPGATHPDAQQFINNPMNKITIGDLDKAIRAEMIIETWSGHAGTSDRRVRINRNDWIPIPESALIGPGRAEGYLKFVYPVVEIPLEQLKQGVNDFEFTSGPQISHDFGFGQWGVYGVTFRIYYDNSKPHPEGRIINPGNNSQISGTVNISAEATSTDSTIKSVDFIGWYEDFDIDGDGIYEEWQYRMRYCELQGHIGTATSAPYSVNWDTSWIPEQDKPIKIIARITDNNGISYMTEEVTGISLSNANAVKLLKPYSVPQAYVARAGGKRFNKVDVGYDLSNAIDAKMVFATWCAAHADEIGINNVKVVGSIGKDHDYSFEEISLPLSLLKQGEVNKPYIYALTEHHGIEVMWPGIAIKIRFNGNAVPVEIQNDNPQTGNNFKELLLSGPVAIEDFDEGVSRWKPDIGGGEVRVESIMDTATGEGKAAYFYFDGSKWQYYMMKIDGFKGLSPSDNQKLALRMYVKGYIETGDLGSDWIRLHLRESVDPEQSDEGGGKWDYAIGNFLNREQWTQIIIPFTAFTGGAGDNDGVVTPENVTSVRFRVRPPTTAGIPPIHLWVDNIELIMTE